jgi:hypothetical protein
MGEGPECHVPKVIVRFKPIPARILKFSRRTHTHTHTHQSECSSQHTHTKANARRSNMADRNTNTDRRMMSLARVVPKRLALSHEGEQTNVPSIRLLEDTLYVTHTHNKDDGGGWGRVRSAMFLR